MRRLKRFGGRRRPAGLAGRLIAAALAFPRFGFGLAIVVAAAGLAALPAMPTDVFPEFAPPMAIVQTEAPGYSSEQVEALLTRPLESALSATPGIRAMRSKSEQGLSMLTLEIADRDAPWIARQALAERLAVASNVLPPGAGPARLLPLTSSANTVLMLGLQSRTRSLMELTDFAAGPLRRQLLSVPGVADAVVFGAATRQLQVQADPARLERYDLTLADVTAAVKQAAGTAAAGFIEGGNQRIPLQLESEKVTPAMLGQAVVRPNGAGALTLDEVAATGWGAAPAAGAASVSGMPALVVTIESQFGANTLAVTRDVEASLASLRPVLDRQGIAVRAVYRPADYIEAARANLGTSLAVGAALVTAVLFLFLGNLRTTLISLLAVPLSLLAAVGVLHALHATLNAMTLAGLTIALGEVVDDAIIDVENIHRRLRANRLLPQPRPAALVVLEASVEVRGSVVFGTAVVLLAFLPLLGLSGIAAAFIGPLALAYILAVLASMAVALTVTPALALVLLAGERSRGEPRWIGALKRRYQGALDGLQRRWRLALAATVLACAAPLACLPFFQTSFLPPLSEGHLVVHVGLAPGSSLQESMRVGARLSAALLRVPGVSGVAQTAGRAEGIVDPAGVHLSELHVSLARMDRRGQDAVRKAIGRILAAMPGINASVNTFLTERIDETIGGTSAPLTVEVIGENSDVAAQTARRIATLLGTLRGAASVSVESAAGVEQLAIRLRTRDLKRWGLQTGPTLDAVEQAYQGTTAGQVVDGDMPRDIVIALAAPFRADAAQVGNLRLRTPDGTMIRLADVADIGRRAHARADCASQRTTHADRHRGGGCAPARRFRAGSARTDQPGDRAARRRLPGFRQPGTGKAACAPRSAAVVVAGGGSDRRCAGRRLPASPPGAAGAGERAVRTDRGHRRCGIERWPDQPGVDGGLRHALRHHATQFGHAACAL
jgi:Cu/Ag efflux pump CusA